MRRSRRKTEISECDWFDCKGTVSLADIEGLAWHVSDEKASREKERKDRNSCPMTLTRSASTYYVRFFICL